MTRLLIGTIALWTIVSSAAGADRLAEVEWLVAEYTAEAEKFFSEPVSEESTTAQRIARFEAWPAWKYIPEFLALAEAKPDDEAAFRSCQWIIDRTSNVGNEDAQIFNADQKAWQILQTHHNARDDLPMLCLRAVWYRGAAQEQFLRGLIARESLSRQKKAFATLALGELLAHKHEYVESLGARSKQPLDEYWRYIERRKSPEWGKDLVQFNAARFKADGIQCLHDAIANYSDIPITISAPYFRDFKTIGEKARTSLHALERLTLGAQAPNISGKDLDGELLDLSNYRGNVVLLKFWSTDCGPCMAMIPEDQKLFKALQGRPFKLLSVCRDEHADTARKAIQERGIEWHCWFDGVSGPIARDYNVLSLPTTYLLDQRGVIVGKDLDGGALEKRITELLEKDQ